jgi:hypothetical protein
MTVFNTNYTSIDEAFGFLNPELQQEGVKKQPKKKNKDPLCELYNQRWQQTPYTDTDLVMYANQYNKNNNQIQNVRGRENKQKFIDISDHPTSQEYTGQEHTRQEYTGQEHTRQEHTGQEYTRQEYESSYDFQPSKLSEITSEEHTPRHTYQESRCLDEDTMIRLLEKKYNNSYEKHDSSNSSMNYIDLILYIISGIILIFMMEQFVKIGMYMQV